MNKQQLDTVSRYPVGDAARFIMVWFFTIAQANVVRRTSVAEISDTVNKSESAVSKLLRELEVAGILEIERYKAGLPDPDLVNRGDIRITLLNQQCQTGSPIDSVQKKEPIQPLIEFAEIERISPPKIAIENRADIGTPRSPSKTDDETHRETESSNSVIPPINDAYGYANRFSSLFCGPSVEAESQETPSPDEPHSIVTPPPAFKHTHARFESRKENTILSNIKNSRNQESILAERSAKQDVDPLRIGTILETVVQPVRSTSGQQLLPGFRRQIASMVEAVAPSIERSTKENIATLAADFGLPECEIYRWIDAAKNPKVYNRAKFLNKCVENAVQEHGIPKEQLNFTRRAVFGYKKR